jgi:hypothetical protein
VSTVRLAVLAATAGVALAAPGAHAATKTVAKKADAGPVLAGSKVLYGVARGTTTGGGSELGVDVRAVAVGGGKPSTLFRFNRVVKGETSNELRGLDADGSRWAAVRQAFAITSAGPDSDFAPAGSDLVAGTLGKRASRLVATFGKCSVRSYKGDPSDVAVVDGGLAVAVESGTCGRREEIELRLGKTIVRLKGAKPRGGGRWLAYQSGAAVVVYDVKLRRQAYRITGTSGERPLVFDPQGDGKVVVDWNGRDDVGRLAWYSKAENRAHDVGVRASELTPDSSLAFVAMAADTIVLPAITDPDVDAETITAVDLAGARTKIADTHAAGGLDDDGRRVAWIDAAGVHVAPLP